MLAFVASAAASRADSGGHSSANSKRFANFRIAYDSATDFLDPGLSYSGEGWAVMWNVYLPLLGYRHVNGPAGATLVPYLAESLPKVSSNGMTYTLTLRKGLVYSNGAPVQASDFKATIERDYKLDSPGVGFFKNIVGADAYGKTKTGGISGISTNDRTGRITIHLATPQADFENVLATTFAALVPGGSPAKDQSTTPLPATGPYLIRSYTPDKQIVVVRNPRFDAAKLDDNVPAGNPDKMTIDVIGQPGIALQRVIDGRDDYDYQEPPPDRIGAIQARYPHQYRIFVPAATNYFFMNTRVKPFTSLDVRRAVNFGIDRQALVRIFGGLATPTQQVLPPTYPQYSKIDLYPYDPAKARELVKASGMADVPITVWNNENPLDTGATTYLAAQLTKMGFTNVRQTRVANRLYYPTIENQATKAQIGVDNWEQDFPHPSDWFDVLLNGKHITQTYNNNVANANFPAINNQIDALDRQPKLTPAVNRRWAHLDRMVALEAPWAPFLNPEQIFFFNSDMDLTGSCYTANILYGFDFALACEK